MATFPPPILTAFVTIVLGACGGHPEERTATMVAAERDEAPAITEGMQQIMDKEGNLLMQGMLHAGLRQGEWTSFYPNGSIRSRATYVDGLQEGPTEVYHGNSALYYRGQYHRDKPVGDWLFYNDEGVQQRLVRYDSLGNQLEQR